METQGAPFDSLRVLPSKTPHVSLLYRKEGLQEMEEVGLFQIGSRIA